MKVLIVLSAETESLFETKNTCCNNPKKSSATKFNKPTASGISLFTNYSFDETKVNLIIIEAEVV